MRKVLLFLVVSFIIMGTLCAHAIIPDSATVEIPTPESDYSQDTDVQSENFAEPEPVAVEPVVDEVTEQTADELPVVDSEAPKEMVAESINVVDVEPESLADTEPVVVEPVVDEGIEQAADEVSVVDSEQVEETTVIETFNDTDAQSENFAEPEMVVVEPAVDEVTEQTSDELSAADSEAPEEMVAESVNVVDVEPESSTDPEPVVVEPVVDEVTEKAADEVVAIDSATTEEMVAESINDAEVELEPIVMEPSVDEDTEQTADELPVIDSEAPEETVAESINDVDIELESSVEPEVYAEPESVVVEPHVDEVAEQPADELSAADPEQADSLLVETEDVAEDEESEQTPYIEDVEDIEENVAETEVPEPVDADVEPIGDDTDDMENVQTVMDIVLGEDDDNDICSVDVQPEEVEPLTESDEETGISGKVLLSMEATHFAWNFSSNGGSSGFALPCSGVSAEWLFSNRFACGINVRVSTESDGTSYRTNLGILNRFGMLSDMKNILNEANVVFFKGDVLLGLTIKDAVGGIATLPTIGLGGSVHFGRDFLTMAFGVDGIVMFPLSGTDRTPVYSIRPNMALTWIL